MFTKVLTKSNIHRLTLAAAIAVAVIAPLPAAADGGPSLPTFGPGVAKISVTDIRTDRPLEGHIWYPTATPDTAPRADKSKVWVMAAADPEGVLAAGKFPLLVISHGMYGNRLNQAWLASELAQRGYIVAMVDHPGTSSFLRDPDQARQLWDRPVDLSRLISFLLDSSSYRHSIDADRIYAAGHSLGGFTVLLSAGAEFDNDLYQAGCFGGARIPVVCDVLGQWSVAETVPDQHAMAQSRKDPRIRKVISLDLGGTPVLSRQSLAAIDIPVLILGAGRGDMLDQALESRALAAAMRPEFGHLVELGNAGHFDFIGICKPGGYAILKEHEPGDEMVCINGGSEREVQHQRIIAEIDSFLSSGTAMK